MPVLFWDSKGEKLIMFILETQKCMLCDKVTHWWKVVALSSEVLLTCTWEMLCPREELASVNMAWERPSSGVFPSGAMRPVDI